jgi:hypothetical protein
MKFKLIEKTKEAFKKIHARLEMNQAHYSRHSDVTSTNTIAIREALVAITSVVYTVLDDLEIENIKVKEEEPWKQEYGYEYGRTKEENEAWVIPFCIEELLRINKKLREYTPSNPELAELTIQEIVCKLSIEMQIQNNVLMTALRHLMGKTEKTKIEESELL